MPGTKVKNIVITRSSDCWQSQCSLCLPFGGKTSNMESRSVHRCYHTTISMRCSNTYGAMICVHEDLSKTWSSGWFSSTRALKDYSLASSSNCYPKKNGTDIATLSSSISSRCCCSLKLIRTLSFGKSFIGRVSESNYFRATLECHLNCGYLSLFSSVT